MFAHLQNKIQGTTATGNPGLPPSPPKTAATGGQTQPKEQPDAMLTSFTTPITMPNKANPPQTAPQPQTTSQPATSQNISTPAKDPKTGDGKNGGTLQQNPQNSSPPPVGAGNGSNAGNSGNPVQEWDLDSII